MRFSFFLSWFVLSNFIGLACQCPLSSLNIDECNKYDLIFKGKIISLKPCENKPGEALFELEELYEGNATQKFTILFECNSECALRLNVGEEWIIYTNHKQLNNAQLNWCSRSRKYFSNDKEDFYSVNYGNDYVEELKFLRDNFGLHHFLPEPKNVTTDRNIKPSLNQSIAMVVISISFILLFYWLFNRYFKTK
jgi:hypothetical protein